MISKKLKYACLFSGIGAPLQGAFRIYGKENIEHVFSCEFDKFARQSFSANYDISPEHFHKDINDLDATQYINEVDVLIGGSPCQSFSLAGLRKGTDEARGQLIYQYIRVVDECKPKIIIYENVKGIMSIDNGNTIKDFVQALRDIGYHCHYGVVNTKDYGVPQNRERLFLVGFLDTDLYHKFHFADKIKLTKRLKDVLEDEVDEKYYLNRELNMTYESQANTVHDIEKESPTLCAFTHGYAGGYITDINRINRTLRVGGGSSLSDKHCFDLIVEPKVVTHRIRKLTTLETWRLQDFPDEAHNKAVEAGLSRSQLYKQAGNSMSVNILEMIFNQIEKAKRGETVGLF